jgi:hypothetical protein
MNENVASSVNTPSRLKGQVTYAQVHTQHMQGLHTQHMQGLHTQHMQGLHTQHMQGFHYMQHTRPAMCTGTGNTKCTISRTKHTRFTARQSHTCTPYE